MNQPQLPFQFDYPSSIYSYRFREIISEQKIIRDKGLIYFLSGPGDLYYLIPSNPPIINLVEKNFIKSIEIL